MKTQVTFGPRALRLALCATAAGAALAMSTAHAAVVTVDFSGNALSTVPFNIDGLYLNVVTGMASTSSFAGYDLNPYFSGTATSAPLFRFLIPSTGGMVGAAATATPLTLGSTVGSSSSFISGVLNANQAVPSTNYFGFAFANEGTGVTNYGYIRVQQSANPVTAGSVRILSYAYENTGASITVSAVPEPSSVLMMMAGLLGVGALGLQRRSQRA